MNEGCIVNSSATNHLPPQSYLKECFAYDLVTGFLAWKVRPRSHFIRKQVCNRWNAKYAGKAAGSIHSGGYRQVSLYGNNYFAHRIVWKIMLADDADGEIDHINHCRTDNRWINLRKVSSGVNNKNISLRGNNKSGVTGVSWCRKNGNWQTHVGGEPQGYYTNLFDAECAVAKARAAKGYHPNHGKAKCEST